MKNYVLYCLIVLVCLIVVTPVCQARINEKILKEAGLEFGWQNAIALTGATKTSPQEKVQKITILGDNIYILTTTNYLFCLDRNTGKPVFSFAVAEARLPVSEPTVYKNIAYLVAANNLIAIDLQQGAERYRKKIPFMASWGVAVNSSYFYFVGIDKLLHATDVNSVADVNNLHVVFNASPNSGTVITSALATDSEIFFATQGGEVTSMTAGGPKKIWNTKAVSAITAPLVKNGNWIYASSKDTNLYKLNAKNGNTAWKFQSGSILTKSARATDTVVYQYAPNKGLFAIDANSGKQMWLLPGAADLLAQDSNNNTAYIIDRNNTCTVMDNKQAKKIYVINFESVTSFGVNTYDSNIYVLENKNISCIRPIKK